MNNRTWAFLSYLFHPLFMPTIGIFIVMWNDPIIYLSFNTVAPWLSVLGVIFACTALFPLFLNWVLYKMQRVSSLYEPTDEDRRMLIVFTELGYILAYLAFHNIPSIGRTLSLFILGINISLIATLLISFVQKTSFHATGAGGIVGTTIGLMYYTRFNMEYWIVAAIAMACLSGYSRYKLKAHNTFEIYLGYIVGILPLALVFILGAKHA
jgi:hypothetical protein